MTGGAVSTSHHLATEAGARALRAGGNAIDAAIAAASALCVVYPNNVALGGDLVALVRDPSGTVSFVNATGRAAREESLEALRERHGDRLPSRGVDTVPVPGGVRGWSALAGLGARLGWSELLGSARDLARAGHPLARSVARAIRADREALDADDGCRGLFLPGGRPLDEGETLTQPALADTIDALISGGPDAFYTGPVAEAWVGGLRSRGSRITLDEVSAYQPVVTDPISERVGGVDIVTSPPNTQGFALLRTLRALTTEATSDPLGRDAARLAELFWDANRVRSALLADPDVAPVAIEDLLAAPAPSGPELTTGVASGDTVGLVAVSDDGWAVSLVQSVFWAFGAAILDPATGVLFQNRGTSFSLDPTHPAAFGGGRRPPHTLMPVLAVRDGALAFALGTMGGQAQAQIHTHLLLRLLAGASPIEATSAPRWVVGAQEDGDGPRTVTVESDVAGPARASLAASGFDVTIVPPRSETLGHSNVIAVRAGGYDAASDPRSDGSAMIIDDTHDANGAA
jgi:gamma-glutamyltranspeptidase/glutathione hydrolase